MSKRGHSGRLKPMTGKERAKRDERNLRRDREGTITKKNRVLRIPGKK